MAKKLNISKKPIPHQNLSEDLLSILNAFNGMKDVSIQIHDNFHPIYVSDGMLNRLGFSSEEEYYQMESLMEIIPKEREQEAKGRYQLVMESGQT